MRNLGLYVGLLEVGLYLLHFVRERIRGLFCFGLRVLTIDIDNCTEQLEVCASEPAKLFDSPIDVRAVFLNEFRAPKLSLSGFCLMGKSHIHNHLDKGRFWIQSPRMSLRRKYPKAR